MSQTKDADSILANTLLHNDMLSEDQIGNCELLQEAMEEDGLHVTLGELILEKGYLTEQHLKYVAAKIKEQKGVNLSNFLPLRMIHDHLSDSSLVDQALSKNVVAEEDVDKARTVQEQLQDYGVNKPLPEVLVEMGVTDVQSISFGQDGTEEIEQQSGEEDQDQSQSQSGGLQIDEHLDRSTKVVDRKDLGKEKVRVLNKKKFRNLISKSIDKVISNRDEDLTAEERKNVSKIVQEQFKESGLQDVPGSLQDFFSEILDELERIKEAVRKVPARTTRLTEMQEQTSKDAGAIVDMMKDEQVQGEVASVDKKEESEGVSSTVERLKQIKQQDDNNE